MQMVTALFIYACLIQTPRSWFSPHDGCWVPAALLPSDHARAGDRKSRLWLTDELKSIYDSW